jgi:hypothetical protein
MIRLAIAAGVLALALIAPGSAMAADEDGDHMRDGWELKHGLSTHKANGRRYSARDHLSNLGEFRAHTDPKDADTDNDCVSDDDEDGDHDQVDNANE